MKFRQTVTTGLLAVLMLALAVAAMGLILSNTRPLDPERVVAPDILK